MSIELTIASAVPDAERTLSAPGRDSTGLPGGGPLRRSFEPGDAFSLRYTIVEELGSGGMGQVYKALDRSLGRTVALKVIRPEAASRGHGIERFHRELALGQQVTHANVCRVYDLGESQGLFFISMEYVDGQTLDDLIQSVGQLSPRQTLGLARQMAAGLAAVHARGIVHRDLKPGNIMIDRSGRARVMDFGMACQGPSDRLTRSGQVVGTLAYLSPEQARGGAADARADLFALGLILFEMLTGRRPPGDGEPAPLALRESGADCVPPSGLAPEVPPCLDRIVLRCLARDPAGRFTSAEDLGRALADAAASLSSSGSHAAWTPVRPHRARRAALAGTLAVLVSAGLVAQQASTRAPRVGVIPLVFDSSADTQQAQQASRVLTGRLRRHPSLGEVVSLAAGEGQGDWRESAERQGAGLVVHVIVESREQGFRGSVRLARRDGPVQAALEYEDNEVFRLVRRLADGVAAALDPPTSDLPALADYFEGLRLLERRDLAGKAGVAAERLRRAVARDPKFALAWAALGEAYRAQAVEDDRGGLMTRALDAVSEAIRLDPREARAFVARARARAEMGSHEAARRDLETAIALDPLDDEALALLAVVLAGQGRFPEAQARAVDAVRLAPEYFRHHATLGYALLRGGRGTEAALSYARAVALEPGYAEGHLMLGTALHDLGRLDEAGRAYDRALAIEGSGWLWAAKATLLHDRGDFAGAVRGYEQALRLEPGRALTHYNLGDALERARRAHEARGAWARAADLARRALADRPDDTAALSLLAAAEAKLGRTQEASIHIGRARALAPGDRLVAYREARILALRGEAREAVSRLAEAVRLGYNVARIASDHDLRSLRQRADFRTLVSRPG
jgi:tetratricopeptide (TPR) repeat protein/predicted Ser/Thr protein kinase